MKRNIFKEILLSWGFLWHVVKADLIYRRVEKKFDIQKLRECRHELLIAIRCIKKLQEMGSSSFDKEMLDTLERVLLDLRSFERTILNFL